MFFREEDKLRRGFLIIILLFLLVNLYTSVKVEYNSQLSSEIINTEYINGIEYFNVFELNKALKAQIKEDIIDQRLKVNIYGEQIIFLLESSYLSFGTDIYNTEFSLISKGDKHFLPVIFLKELLPLLYPSKIEFSNNKIIADTPVDKSIRTIVLDPGHGGKDPGAIGYSKNNYEKDIVLKIAKTLKKDLEKNLDVNVFLTRESDEFISLQQRTLFANQCEADLFISIHINAHPSNKAHGIEVYYLSTAKTDDARAVEALENSVVYDYEGGEKAVKEYDDLAFILADMAQSEHLEESYQQALKIQHSLVKHTKARDRGVKQANFYVLRGAFMPAVLLELGYITNKEEEKKLIKFSYQDKLTKAIFEGIKDFKYKFDQMQ